MIMETEKFLDLQSASWRPRRADGVSFRLKFSRFQTQEEPRFQFSLSPEAGKYRHPSSEPVRQEDFSLRQHFCSTQEVKRLDEAHPHQGGQHTLLSLLIQMLISAINTRTDASRIVLDQISRRQF